ncbi:MAG TPA: L,D-transpeptidase [Thermomicrobiales bacterium]|nr:L,D-transpeptidase [Thermomicrobiales bacterium]
MVATAGSLRAWTETTRVKVRGKGIPALLLASLAILTGLFAPLVPSASAQWAAPRTVYIDETGQILDQAFLDLWRAGNGASSYGYPVTPEITLENGHIVQYMQFARFEYWPERNANGEYAFVASIGEELRPLNLQRSVSTFTSTTAPTSTGNAEVLHIQQAWLPIADLSAADLSAGARFVDATQHSVRGGFREFWENTGEAAYLGNPLTEEYQAEGVTYQVFERGQLKLNADSSVSMVPVGQLLADKYRLDQAPQPQGELPSYSEDLFVPPAPTVPGVYGYDPNGGAVVIDINLSTQYMTVYQGDAVIGETYISSGRDQFATPTGTFWINNKYEFDDMDGVLGGEYYNVPQVPDVMYFTDVGHAIHGAYWHDNFGSPMSHGCVNVPLAFAEWLFDISPSGTRVDIHY